MDQWSHIMTVLNATKLYTSNTEFYIMWISPQLKIHTHTPFSFIRLENNRVTINLCGSAGKESAYNVGDLGSIPGLGRSPREGKCYPLQYSGLENSMDCIVYRVAKSWTRLSNFHSFTHYYKPNIILSIWFKRYHGSILTSLVAMIM